jgi:hypothetical protein
MDDPKAPASLWSADRIMPIDAQRRRRQPTVMAITVVTAHACEIRRGFTFDPARAREDRAMRSLETIELKRFPVIPGLLARGLRYLDNEFENAAGLAMMFTQRPMLKGGAIAVVLVMWVAALASQLSLFGADRALPTPADLIAMTIGALATMFPDVARVAVLGCRAA